MAEGITKNCLQQINNIYKSRPKKGRKSVKAPTQELSDLRDLFLLRKGNREKAELHKNRTEMSGNRS